VHGVGEHSSRYAHVAAAMAAAGYAMISIDLRGHGKSAGKRGFVPTYDILLDDIDLLLAEAAQRYPGKARFLYGHSLGGNLVLYYSIRRKPAIQGVIDSAGQLQLAFTPPAAQLMVGRLMNRLMPGFSMASGLDTAVLSHDPAVISAYRADPLVHDRLSAALGIGLLNSGEWTLKHANEFPPIPLLVMHGLGDRITSAEASRQFASQVHGDVVFKPWDNLYHEIHNEPEKQAVIDFMIKWIGDHLS
jgi:alpha-beta hydrolase superfamily lysophospholipase